MKYSWFNYNLKRNKEANKIYKFLKKTQINFIESGVYKNVRDIYALSLLIGKSKKNKIKVLDYGGNLMSHVNLINKISTKNIEISVFNPFIEKIPNNTFLKIKFLKNFNSKANAKAFDLVYFGSVIQYLNTLKYFSGKKELLKSSMVLITHTPISFGKKRYFLKQKNAKNLFQNIYTLRDIQKDLLKNKFNIIFKSINENKYTGLAKKYKDVYSANLLMKKK